MTTMYYEADANPEILKKKKIAILGYGSQGHAHALNLHDSGYDVRVGLRPESSSVHKAEEAGLRVLSIGDACAEADVIMVLVPDTEQKKTYDADIAPHLSAGKCLLFAHGFNIRFNLINPPADVDVAMVAPKGPGHLVRRTYVEGGGVPALIAVHHDATGHAHEIALAYADGIGATRAGVLETTFTEETETDLFGEQAVLCGGAAALVKCGFEVLTEAGYQPELAYFEVLHELKLIVDLLYRGGLEYMNYSISDTAEWGGYEAQAAVVTPDTKKAMQKLLSNIQDGSFAKKFINENETGRHGFAKYRDAERNHPVEKIGATLRPSMPFLDPVKIVDGHPVKA